MINLHDKKKAVQLYSVSKLNTFLSYLDGVHKSGDGFRSKCPAHEGDNDSILSIRETEDGRVLVKCFYGCEVKEVLSAIGLEFADIMPERLTHHATPEQRRKWKQDALHKDWAGFVNDLLYESRIVHLANQQIRRGEPLDDEKNERLDLSLERIERIGRLFNGKS